MHPVMRLGRRVGEAHQLAHGLGQHRGVELAADHPIVPAVLFQQRRGEAVVAEAAAALPADGLGDAAGIVAVDHLLQARDDVGVAVLAQLDHDPASPHLVGDGAGGAGTGEGVENEVTRISRDSQESA